MTQEIAGTDNSTVLPPQTEKLITAIVERIPTHRNFLNEALSQLTTEELQGLETYIGFCAQSDVDTTYLAECYGTFVEDTLKEQIYFHQHKEYRYSSFEEVAGEVYFNKEYMEKYMYGVAVSMYFWPNHRKTYQFFLETLPTEKTGQYLEIGPGHGTFIMSAMEKGKFVSFQGIDVSATSAAMTQEIIDHFQPEMKDKYEIEVMDFIDSDLPSNTYDAVVMGEVLEHVESPDIFLKRIADIARDDAYIFVTTCINAPTIDHIYLYKTTDEAEDMIRDCGLEIVQPLRMPYEGKSLEECREELLPINVAYVLKKRV